MDHLQTHPVSRLPLPYFPDEAVRVRDGFTVDPNDDIPSDGQNGVSYLGSGVSSLDAGLIRGPPGDNSMTIAPDWTGRWRDSARSRLKVIRLAPSHG